MKLEKFQKECMKLGHVFKFAYKILSLHLFF